MGPFNLKGKGDPTELEPLILKGKGDPTELEPLNLKGKGVQQNTCIYSLQDAKIASRRLCVPAPRCPKPPPRRGSKGKWPWEEAAGEQREVAG